MNNMSIAEMITYSTVMIRCEYSNGMSGSGTGFIINLCKNEEKDTCVPVLITNNHVVANSVKTVFEFCVADDDGNPIDNQSFTLVYEGNSWIRHPDSSVDLCCLLLAEALNELRRKSIKIFYIPLETDLIPSHEDLEQLFAMEDVVMVGYPIGLSDTYNHKPVIRRGITSSHPKKDYQGKKETLLDMACYPGSSGSPVFILNQGIYPTADGLVLVTEYIFLGCFMEGRSLAHKGHYNLLIYPMYLWQ